MKLRTQFGLLVGGIIAVPFLVGAFVLLLHYLLSLGQEPIPNYGQISAWIRREVPRAVASRSFGRLGRDRSAGLDILILDRDDTIAFSTIPELPAGKTAQSGQIFRYIRENSAGYHFQIDSPRMEDGTQRLLVLKVPKPREGTAFRNQALLVVMYTSIALLGFSSLMSFLILRSLNRSLLTLEGATRRVAGGDLDFELPLRGNDEISSLTRSFDRMRRALKEEYARRARFIMGVSHDLKTPLALIQGYVEAIADGYAAEPQVHKRYLAIIQDKTQSLEAMIADLIEFVKMETGQWRTTFKQVRLKGFLTQIAKRYAEDALILRREFRAAIDLPEGLTVAMDEGLVSRALENLIGNAIRYTEEGGSIELAARRQGGEVALAITDTGIGIPQEELGRIFDPFYRGTNSRREQGFGLGLTTVKSIIDSHGWSLEAASALGQGTTFTIRLAAPGTGTP